MPRSAYKHLTTEFGRGMKAILAQKEANAREEEVAEQSAVDALKRKEKEQQEATARVTADYTE